MGKRERKTEQTWRAEDPNKNLKAFRKATCLFKLQVLVRLGPSAIFMSFLTSVSSHISIPYSMVKNSKYHKYARVAEEFLGIRPRIQRVSKPSSLLAKKVAWQLELFTKFTSRNLISVQTVLP